MLLGQSKHCLKIWRPHFDIQEVFCDLETFEGLTKGYVAEACLPRKHVDVLVAPKLRRYRLSVPGGE